MSADQFRDAIAAAVHLPGISEANETWAQADAVLAMPEMQAIRRALRVLAESAANCERCGDPDDDVTADLMLSGLLDPDLRAWVLGGYA